MKETTNEFSFILKPSKFGVGVFAAHEIKSDTKLAINKEGGETRVLDVKDIPRVFKDFTIALEDGKRIAPKEFNHMWLVWYLNHSKNPNAELNVKENNYYSIKDIREGEEILINYNSLDEPESEKEEYYK